MSEPRMATCRAGHLVWQDGPCPLCAELGLDVTREMIIAGEKAYNDGVGAYPPFLLVEKIYRAMSAAANGRK